MLEYYSRDYSQARERFRDLAMRMGFRLRSYPIAGEQLTLDVAVCGPAEATTAVVISSGLHGIEGFFGSAVQLAWLGTRTTHGSAAKEIRVILAHALNPHGFAHLRRWNENNVDLNRNFLIDRRFLDSDPAYQETLRIYESLDGFLNPRSRPSPWDPYRLKALWTLCRQGLLARGEMQWASSRLVFNVPAILQLGIRRLQRTLPVGQYRFPRGLFFGGSAIEASTRLLMQEMPGWVGGSRRVIHIDFHTGLGRWAEYKLLLPATQTAPEEEAWFRERFGRDVVEPLDGNTAYPARGSMLDYFAGGFPDRQYHCMAAEFGTYDQTAVLRALRAENRAHFFDKPGTKTYRWAKREITEVFCPASTEWRAVSVERGLQIIERALAAGTSQT